ncbi:hypothetical protein ABW19_dt0200365 [Dactylella cylindrospora]|nr:hypothetical protein ABW19_dt0200365 [Dactylella cylindrospora]
MSTQRRPNSTLSTAETFTSESIERSKPSPPPPSPLSTLPTPYLLRTILICTISTNPFLSNLLTKTLLAYSNFLTSNPVTRFILQHTFYNHFCAGSTQGEIQSTLARLKSWGFRGIILAYAKEVEVVGSEAVQDTTEADIKSWKEGTLRTIEYSEPGSYVAIKYSGAGATSVLAMQANQPPSPLLTSALSEICTLARTRNIKLLFDAEQARYQDAMDAYTLSLMRTFNPPSHPPIIYNTYQMYRRISPSNLRNHLELARKEGFSFGAKVVRGAYLSSDPRDGIWGVKEETDASYNEGISHLITYPSPPTMKIGIVVATHNQDSVTNAMKLLKSGAGQDKEIVFAQLAGMADEVSMSVINGNFTADGEGEGDGLGVNVVKYIPWGTMEECVKYLLRRADENKDSLKRTDETRRAAWREVWRRAFGGSG